MALHSLNYEFIRNLKTNTPLFQTKNSILASGFGSNGNASYGFNFKPISLLTSSIPTANDIFAKNKIQEKPFSFTQEKVAVLSLPKLDSTTSLLANHTPAFTIPKITIPNLSNTPTKQSITPTKGLSNKAISGIEQGVGAGLGVAGVVGNSILEGKRKSNRYNSYGVLYHDNNTDYKENRLNSVVSMAGEGAALGSVVPGWGTLIGAAAGAIGGFFMGRRKAKQHENIANTNYGLNTVNAKAAFTRSQDASRLTAFAKAGMKIKIGKALSTKGTEEIPGVTKNLIPKGTLHARKNAMGDKGMPVVLKNGEKIIEIEKDEIIFTKDATDKIENLVDKYNSSKDDKYLIQLGTYLTTQILDNTVDNSEKQILNEV